MTTLQETRHRKISNSISHMVALRDEGIARLVRYESRLKLLRKQLARLERTMAAPPKPAPVIHPDPVEAAPSLPIAEPAPEPDVPTFLDRRLAAEARDAAARAEVEQQNAERKKAKAQIAAEKRKVKAQHIEAKLTGETRKMPLTGRAALAKIMAG
jgi:hypothetical protein